MERFLSKAKDIHGQWVKGYYVYMGVICKDRVSMRMEHMILSMKNDDPESLTQTVILVETLCQCTGTTVKNGKLLFEGDIVRGKWFIGQYHYNEAVIEYLDKIVKCDDYYIYKGMVARWTRNRPESEKTYSRLDTGNWMGFEIIGNVHDKE